MQNPTRIRTILRRASATVLILLASAPPVAAEGIWNRLKQGAADTVEKSGELISEGATKAQSLTEQGIEKGAELTEKGAEIGGKAIQGGIDYGKEFVDDTAEHFNRDGTPEEIRAKVDQMAIDTLDQLFSKYPESQLLLTSGYGYAVFEVRQVSLAVTAGYGYGVAESNDGARHIYMKMVTGGLGISQGLGGFASRLVVLFSTPDAFDQFVEIGLDAGAQAEGMLGKERADLATHAQSDTTIYRVTDGGLKVAASLTGTRFWPDAALNETQPPQ